MHNQESTQSLSIYWKWETFLPNVRCRNEVADIFPLPTLFFNEKNIASTIKILQEIAKRLKLFDKVVGDKIILSKINLLIIRNCRSVIYWQKGKQLIFFRFHQLELIARLFYLYMNFLSMLLAYFGVLPEILIYSIICNLLT